MIQPQRLSPPTAPPAHLEVEFLQGQHQLKGIQRIPFLRVRILRLWRSDGGQLDAPSSQDLKVHEELGVVALFQGFLLEVRSDAGKGHVVPGKVGVQGVVDVGNVVLDAAGKGERRGGRDVRG